MTSSIVQPSAVNLALREHRDRIAKLEQSDGSDSWITVGTPGVDGVDSYIAANPPPYNDTPWVPFQNGWTWAGGGQAPVQFKRFLNWTHIRGAFFNPVTADGTVVFTLPAIFAPQFEQSTVGPLADGSGTFSLIVGTNGDVTYVTQCSCSGGGGGGGGTVTEVTSDDMSVTVTNPSGPIVDLSVTFNVLPPFEQTTDPGAVGAGALWINTTAIAGTTNRPLLVRNDADTDWIEIALAHYDASNVLRGFVTLSDGAVVMEYLDASSVLKAVVVLNESGVFLYTPSSGSVQLDGPMGALKLDPGEPLRYFDLASSITMSLLTGEDDPTAGGGIPADAPASYLRINIGAGSVTELWLKTGAADTDWTLSSTTIGEITSTDGTVTVTNPTGPTTDLSVIGGLGVWKTYGVDSYAPFLPLAGVTVGNGTLIGRWWTPGPVVADPDTPPFACLLHIFFAMGSTSSVGSDMFVRFPILVDGTGNDLVPSNLFTPIMVGSIVAATGVIQSVGFSYNNGSIRDVTGATSWGPTVPGVWADGDILNVDVAFQAKFAID